MAYQLKVTGLMAWVGDGTGSMFVPGAQSMQQIVPLATVPGGDAPTAANIVTACNTAATSLAALFNTAVNLGIIQGWASGSP